MSKQILKIDKYCSEINWEDKLIHEGINLVVAPTGSGKTKVFMDMSMGEKNVAFVAPFLSITNQVQMDYPDISIETGMKANESISVAGGRITSFHSIPKMLELESIDLLVIDEIHCLTGYAGYTYGMLTTFWNTVQKLREKHPKMKIVALTGTPQFIRMYPLFEFNEIVVKTKTPLSKPSEVIISKSWVKELPTENNYIYLYPSKNQGYKQANKYNGAYIDSATKGTSVEYEQILQGKMPSNRVFTSTLLSTGISILEPVDTVYTDWVNLVDIIQISARPRLGGHVLKVKQTIPFFLRGGMDKPILDWTGNFEKDMKLLNKYQTWYSYIAHSGDANTLFAVIYQMLHLPQDELPEIYY